MAAVDGVLRARIRARLHDGELTDKEIGELVDVAAAGGVTESELRLILGAVERTPARLTATRRGHIWASLAAKGERSALPALERTATSGAPAQRLDETIARLQVLAQAASEARTSLSLMEWWVVKAFDERQLDSGVLQPRPGQKRKEIEQDIARLKNGQAEVVRTKAAFSAFLETLPQAEREMALASLDPSASRALHPVAKPIEPKLLAGMTAADRSTASWLAPQLPESDATDVAGLRLEGNRSFGFSTEELSFVLPDGARIATLPNGGSVGISGKGVILPGGNILDGTARIIDGAVHLTNGARLRRGGLAVVASDEARVELTDRVVSGGPGLKLELQRTDDSSGWDAKERVQFSLRDSELPDGTRVQQAAGSFEACVEGGKIVGWVPGSIKLRNDASVRLGAGKVPRGMLGGSEDQLQRGEVIVQGGRVVGFKDAQARVHGVGLETGPELTSFAMRSPSELSIGRGATVTALPERELVLRGESFAIELGGKEVVVERGGVLVSGGEVVAILSDSVVRLPQARISTGEEGARLLAAPAQLPASGNAIVVGDERISARGRGLVIDGVEKGLLPADFDPVFDTSQKASVALRDGSVVLTTQAQPGLAPGFTATITGDVAVSTGALSYDTRRGSKVGEAREVSGPRLLVQHGAQRIELDPRPIWGSMDPASDPGRIRRPDQVDPAGRFAGTTAAAAGEILAGRRALRRGASGELVSRVQRALSFVLGREVGSDGQLGANTEVALRAFQRLSLLPQTGAVDAATLRQLDAAAPASLARRRKVMVMLAMNDEVPDELRRFRQLAAERGAEPIIIGVPGTKYPSPSDLERLFALAERGEIDLDWLAISGHSTGSSVWGKHGSYSYEDLGRLTRAFPQAAAEIETLSLLNCYNVTVERANSFWPTLFPNVRGMAGFMYSAPGVKSQSSDEHLLHSGRLLAGSPKGEVPSEATARSIGRQYANDRYIREQNASIWVRYAKEDGDTSNGHFDMTPSARREAMLHGAGEELEVATYAQARTFRQYLEAQGRGFESPPLEHHRGPLREYLNAVDGVLGRWEARLRERDRHTARAERDSSYAIPEEFRSAWSWDSAVEEIRETRSQILFLIYFDSIKGFFAEKYAPTIQAFNDYLAAKGISARFPNRGELARMSRKEVLSRLSELERAIATLPDASDERPEPSWRMMTGTEEGEKAPTSPKAFVGRARDFLGDLSSRYIRPEWL